MIVEFAREAIGSPWVYLVIAAVAATDAFFPLVPSETVVIVAGAFAATGKPSLLLVIAAATLGAFAGDHVSYGIGRTAGSRLLSRVRAGSRRQAAFDWAASSLSQRGGLIILVARYIPGGRTATTLTSGAFGYPLRAFSGFVFFAALSWGCYATFMGYFGGMLFEREPLKGVLLGLAIALAFTVLIEVARRLRRARNRVTAASEPPGRAERSTPTPRR